MEQQNGNTCGNTDIKVSVIVLAYNHEKYIKQALDSILMQDVDFCYEILVGDDASSDNTPEILRKYQEKFPQTVKVIYREKNVGPTRNAYELFMLAQGEYIATCEGDDFWLEKDKLRKQVYFLDHHQEYVGCSHISRLVDENGIPLKKQKIRWVCCKTHIQLKDFRGAFLPGQASALVRRNIYKTDHDVDYSFFYKAHSAIGDRTTALTYLSRGDFYKFNETMGCYRIVHNSNSVTVQKYKNNQHWISDDLQYTRNLMDYAVNVLHSGADFHYHLADLYISTLLYCLRRRDKSSAKILSEIWNTAPKKSKLLLCFPEVFIRKIINRFTAV